MKVALKLTWYQQFFNKRFGYRKEFQKSFTWYMKQYIKSYIINFYYYSDKVSKPYQKSVEKLGSRGGHTGNYKTVMIPKSKANYENYKVTFLPKMWISFSIGFDWSNQVFRSYAITFNLEKINWQIKIKLQNNTA